MVKKFAWIPTMVHTWRPRGSKAIIWLQDYYIDNNSGPFIPLGGHGELGRKHCKKLCTLSHEF